MAGLGASRDNEGTTGLALGKYLKGVDKDPVRLVTQYLKGEAMAKELFSLTWAQVRLKASPDTFEKMAQLRVRALSDKTAWIKFKSMEKEGRQMTGWYAQWVIKSGGKPPSGTQVDECKEHVIEEAWKAECEEKAKARRRALNKKGAAASRFGKC